MKQIWVTLTFSIFPDFSLTTLEFPVFSRWVVTLLPSLYLPSPCTLPFPWKSPIFQLGGLGKQRAGSGTESQPKSILVHFSLKICVILHAKIVYLRGVVWCQCRRCRCWTCHSRSEVGPCQCRNTTCQCASAYSAHSSRCSRTVRQARTSAAATKHLSSRLTTLKCKRAQSLNDVNLAVTTWYHRTVGHWPLGLAIRFAVFMGTKQIG